MDTPFQSCSRDVFKHRYIYPGGGTFSSRQREENYLKFLSKRIQKSYQGICNMDYLESWTPSMEKLLRSWKYELGIRQHSHNISSIYYRKLHYAFGIPTAVISSIVSAGILSTFKNCTSSGPETCEQSEWIRVGTGIINVVSIVLVALQTFMEFPATSEKHKKASDLCEGLSRHMDEILRMPKELRGDARYVVQDIRTRYDNIVTTSPPVTTKPEISTLNQPITETIIPINYDIHKLQKLLDSAPNTEESSTPTNVPVDDVFHYSSLNTSEESSQKSTPEGSLPRSTSLEAPFGSTLGEPVTNTTTTSASRTSASHSDSDQST
jgi:hypothetical protein